MLVFLSIVVVGFCLIAANVKSIANMIYIAFFFCLCPLQYTGTTIDDQVFCLNNGVILSRMLTLK